MSTIDASQCWRIMPFSLFDGETEWWVLGPDHQPVDGGIVPTREQAFAMALEHNKAYGVNAVYVYTTSSMNKGNWQQPPTTMMTPEPPVEILLQCWHILPVTPDEGGAETWWVLGQNNTAEQKPSTAGPFSTKEEAFAIALEHNKAYGINAVYVHGRSEKDGEIAGDFEGPSLASFEEAIIGVGDQAMKNVLKNNEQSPNAEIWEQMDKDFEDYLEKMAAGTYAEAAQVEKEVREGMKASPHIPEENLRKLAVAAIAARKRLHEMGFVGRFHKVKQLLGSAKQLFKNVISFVGSLVLFVAVMALSYCSEIISIISPAKTPETSETVDGKNDCVIVATEAYKRLRAEGVWAEVIGMKIKTPKGKTYGHAMCVYQPSKTDNLWVYDSNGSWQLSVQSADLRVIEWALNQSLKDGYSASEFKVLAQEPVKARPARKAPGLQAAQRR